ncbi:hypothetical protein SGL43_03323 [Streptomyces globisporus]|uniref:Uncharacterized protein n=1 Tax=Streptomyces globisporus TaxID=1908 RepID=A0ABM9GXE9_STRGL|nr:hypothetical protein SGL43_03323 [Streptomyces globisporus]
MLLGRKNHQGDPHHDEGAADPTGARWYRHRDWSSRRDRRLVSERPGGWQRSAR